MFGCMGKIYPPIAMTERTNNIYPEPRPQNCRLTVLTSVPTEPHEAFARIISYAGSAEMTKKPYALANALRKIDADPLIEAVQSKDVAQLFIDNPQEEKKNFLDGLFDTHPPIKKRIELLEQFV